MPGARSKHSQPTHVFINCPFDDEYQGIFNAIVFAILDSGFQVRCAKEIRDSSSVRIENIHQLILESALSIHDISRVELNAEGLPRFNMPYEMGLFIGCKNSGSRIHANKRALILDSEPYRYQKFISDISGQDIQYHHTDSDHAIRCVRDWLSTFNGSEAPSSSIMIDRYHQFSDSLPDLSTLRKWKHDELTYHEYLTLTTSWLEANI